MRAAHWQHHLKIKPSPITEYPLPPPAWHHKSTPVCLAGVLVLFTPPQATALGKAGSSHLHSVVKDLLPHNVTFAEGRDDIQKPGAERALSFGSFQLHSPLFAGCIQPKQQPQYSQHPQWDVKVLLKEKGESMAPYGASFSSAPGFFVVNLPMKRS